MISSCVSKLGIFVRDWMPALILLLISPMVLAAEGGRSGNGGGTGIACFTSQRDAQSARDLRTAGQPLPRTLLKKIWYLYTTEVAEHDITFFDYGEYYYFQPSGLEVNEKDGYKAYLDRMLSTYLEQVSPSFEHKIKDIIHNHFDPSVPGTVSEVGALVPLDDTGPVPVMNSIGPSCAIVQIVIRHAETLPDGKIKSDIKIDADLFNMLGTNTILGSFDRGGVQNAKLINQAALILHEALYFLGYGLGQTTSESVRAMVTLLMSQQTLKAINDLELNIEAQRMITQLKNHEQLHDLELPKNAAGALYIANQLYRMGFADFPSVDNEPLSLRADELHRAYLKIERLITGAGNFNAAGPTVSETIVSNVSVFSDPEAFIVMANASLVTGKINDIYALLDPSVDSNPEFNAVCDYTKESLNQLRATSDPAKVVWAELYGKVLRYCETK